MIAPPDPILTKIDACLQESWGKLPTNEGLSAILLGYRVMPIGWGRMGEICCLGYLVNGHAWNLGVLFPRLNRGSRSVWARGPVHLPVAQCLLNLWSAELMVSILNYLRPLSILKDDAPVCSDRFAGWWVAVGVGVLLPIAAAAPVSAQHVSVQQATAAPFDSGTTVGALVYSNTNSDLPFPPGAGRRIADDIVLTSDCPCNLDRYSFTVSGGGDGTGPGFSVDYGLYDGCPNGAVTPGTLIPGTSGTATFSDDGVHVITLIHDGAPLAIPPSFWLAVTFDRNGAGWMTGQTPELGFSGDFYDHPNFPCVAGFGGNLFASFAAQVFCSPIVPTVASLPNPPDGAFAVPAETLLSWNTTTASSGLTDTDHEAEEESADLMGPHNFVSGTVHPDEFNRMFWESVERGEIPDPADREIPDVTPREDWGGIAAGGGVPAVTADDLFLFEDVGDVLSNPFSFGMVQNIMTNAANAVMTTHGDNFDFVAFFLSFPPDPGSQIGGAFYSPVENDVGGIGLGISDNRAALGIAGDNVEGFVMMWNQANWSTSAQSFTQLVLGQEFEHRFGMFLAPLPGGRPLQGNNSSCGRGSHWNFRADGQGSGMEIPEWVGSSPAVRQGGILNFNSDIPGGVFSYPDLYLMGYVSGAEMDAGASELRYMDNNTSCNSVYNGPISTWGSADIIATNGNRSPGSFTAQKHFRTAWVMLHRPGVLPTSTQLNRVVTMLNHWNGHWINGTLGRGTMTNVLNPPDPCAPSYDVFLGPTNPPTSLVCAGVAEPLCDPGLLPSDATQFWQVVTQVSEGVATGPVWSFTTGACQLPAAPQNPVPVDVAVGVPLLVELNWNGSITAGIGGGLCETTYDVLFGINDPPTALLCDSIDASSCSTGILEPEQTYHWQVIASTPAGPVAGPVWSFSTEACDVPQAAFGPLPVNGGVSPSVNTTLTWNNEPITIRFDEVPDGTVVHGMVIEDVLFGNPEGGALVGGQNLDSGFLQFPALQGVLGDTVTLDFAIPVFGISYGVGQSTAVPVANATTMTLFDAASNLIGTFSGDLSDLGFGFIEGTNQGISAVPIARAVIVQNNAGAQFFAIDNLVYLPIPPLTAAAGMPSPAFGVSQPAIVGQGLSSSATDMIRNRWLSVMGDAGHTRLNTDDVGSAASSPEVHAGDPVAGGIGCPPSYDVFFGTDNPPTSLICEGAADRACNPGPLLFDTTYFWQVVTHKPGQVTSGPVWSFDTPCTFNNSDPPNCAIDARQPFDLASPSIDLGWRIVTMSFGCSTAEMSTEDFSVSVESGVPPLLLFVQASGNDVTLELIEPIPLGQWTCFTHNPSQATMCLNRLPGDVNADGTSSPADILAVIDALNGVLPRPIYATDADRSGVAGPEDILRVIDLLNGAAAFDPWLDVSIGPCPTAP